MISVFCHILRFHRTFRCGDWIGHQLCWLRESTQGRWINARGRGQKGLFPVGCLLLAAGFRLRIEYKRCATKGRSLLAREKKVDRGKIEISPFFAFSRYHPVGQAAAFWCFDVTRAYMGTWWVPKTLFLDNLQSVSDPFTVKEDKKVNPSFTTTCL